MKMKKKLLVAAVLSGMIFQPVLAADQPVLVNIKRMSLETATKIAQAAIKQCRKEGVQIAVTVVDRGGHPQVVLRDVLAPDITVKISRQKAHTAMAFNSALSAMEDRFTKPFSVGKVGGLLFSAGGVPVHAGGTIVGGVGVSGAPSGKTDEKCAAAGVEAVSGDLEFAE
jgi:uncharacterized protein GlcG (DUF336 family)